MTLDEILEEWKVDCRLDEYELDRDALRISEYHHKYLRILSDERGMLKAMRLELYRFEGELRSYLRGELNNPEDLLRLGREPFGLRILEKNMDNYINQDALYLKQRARIVQQEEKVAALEEIMNSLGKRGFQIKEAIEFQKLKSGF